MKKLLLFFALVVTSVTAWADRWTAPGSTDYPNSTPLYVTVTVDDVATTSMPAITEIAAFIDGECRAQATRATNGRYVLRVRGGDADQGKTITLKAVYNGLVYKFNRTETFDGEADTHDVPLALTLHPLRGIEVDENPIKMTVNGTYDVSQHINYVYGLGEMWMDENQGEHYAGVPEADRATTIDEEETPLTVRYDAGNGAAYLSVDENGVITALQETEFASFGIYVEGPADETGYRVSFDTWPQVIISLPVVEEIVVEPTEITAYVWESISDLIGRADDSDKEYKVTVSMLPANAGQDFYWEPAPESSDAIVDGDITMPGDWQVLIYSSANQELEPVVVNIHAVEQLYISPSSEMYDNALIGTLRPTTFKLYLNTIEGFDPSLLSITVDNPETAAPAITYTVGEVVKNEVSEDAEYDAPYYVTITLQGRYVGEVGYNVCYGGEPYNGEPIGDNFSAIVVPELKIDNGWQWVSPYAYQQGGVGDIYVGNNSYAEWLNNIKDMRTQEGLLYNDPTLGIFGDITRFDCWSGMYKIKSQAEESFYLVLGDNVYEYDNYHAMELAKDGKGSTILRGYNWIIYPYEFPLQLSELQYMIDEFGTRDGDQIISKDGGFAEFSDGEWVAEAGFTFQPGEGYMYYSNMEGDDSWQFNPYFNIYENTPLAFQEVNVVSPDDPEYPTDEPNDPWGAPRRKAQARQHGWVVDASQFADNMTIVASLSLPQDSRYVIGAFVDGECRGTGSMVRDGIAFISVAGKNGERVTFCLLDSQTGETFDIDQSLTYTKKAGSVKAPVHMSSEFTTGISTIDNGQLTNDNAVVYDLNGRRVEKPTKGIYVVNGKKVIF